MDQEQRSAPRVDVEPDFSVLVTSGGEKIMGIVYDISRTGVLVDVSQNDVGLVMVPEGERVAFQVVPEFLAVALQGASGTVVRRAGPLWGVQFVDPLDLSQTRIDQLREHLEVPNGPEWNKF
ncbi:PilZ domain-containing protein [Desulfonatronum thioautotrophicum]|uniref:PilZ domain-containing protein n=1 Tax=Desulfonatronum thioautotrophicum TaxID=617001 RepID=UPI0005EB05C0|nr:PilZ domain-containing protein [Desulfonatronum thioautotrophicum]